MTAPVRRQRSRRAGFRLQAHSIAVNGLPAVVVSRPSKWGNPYKITPAFESREVRFHASTDEMAVALFRNYWESAIAQWPASREALAELRGKNLACWCQPGAPCHADVLLELANRPTCNEVRP